MGYEQDLDDILSEMERIYRRAMEAPLSNLSPEQVMQIKNFQFQAKSQKEKRAQAMPDLKSGYAEIQKILDDYAPESSEYQQANLLKNQLFTEIEDRRLGLKHALEQLENILKSQ